MKIVRSFSLTLCQRIMLRIAFAAIARCNFSVGVQIQTRDRILQSLEGFISRGY